MSTIQIPNSADIPLPEAKNIQKEARAYTPGTLARLIVNTLSQGKHIGIHLVEGGAVFISCTNLGHTFMKHGEELLPEPDSNAKETLEYLPVEPLTKIINHLNKYGISQTWEVMNPGVEIIVGAAIGEPSTKMVDFLLQYPFIHIEQ